MINILNNSQDFKSGYILKLEKKSAYSGTVKVDNATSVVFVAGSYYIYLNSTSVAVSSNLMEQFEKLQKALDYLSLRCIQDASIRIPLGHYFYWQLSHEGYLLKLTERSATNISFTYGDIPKLEIGNFHEGFRFFRFAQIAHDLYDAYRNLWLSFESLITTHTPRKVNTKGKPEPEASWYTRALNELAQTSKSKELNDLLTKESSKVVMNKLYKEIRCSLFHSKYGKSVLIPHKIEQYERVKECLTELTIIVAAIFEYHYSIRLKSGWMTPNAFIHGSKGLFDGIRFVVSDHMDEKTLSGEQFKELNIIMSSDQVTHNATKMTNHVEQLLCAHVAVAKNKSLQIRRFAFANDNEEVTAFILDEELNTEGVSDIEIEQIINFGYVGKPRTYDFRII